MGSIDPTGWTKLAVVVLVILSTTFLAYTGKMEGQAVSAILAAALGYVFGNAHGVISSAQAVLKSAATVPAEEEKP